MPEAKPTAQASGGARVKPWGNTISMVHPDSPRTGDGAIQAYNLRASLTNDPEHRIVMDAPPENYDPEAFRHYIRRYTVIKNRCEGTASYNSPILPGANHDYPEASWAERERITKRHADWSLGWLYYLQNDPAVDQGLQEQTREWGLSHREWTDNGHITNVCTGSTAHAWPSRAH